MLDQCGLAPHVLLAIQRYLFKNLTNSSLKWSSSYSSPSASYVSSKDTLPTYAFTLDV